MINEAELKKLVESLKKDYNIEESKILPETKIELTLYGTYDDCDPAERRTKVSLEDLPSILKICKILSNLSEDDDDNYDNWERFCERFDEFGITEEEFDSFTNNTACAPPIDGYDISEMHGFLTITIGYNQYTMGLC